MAATGKPVCAKRPGASPLAPKALKPQSERQTNDRIVTGWRQMAARRTTDQQQTSTSYIYTNAPLDAGRSELRGVISSPGAWCRSRDQGYRMPETPLGDHAHWAAFAPEAINLDAGIFDSRVRALYWLMSL